MTFTASITLILPITTAFIITIHIFKDLAACGCKKPNSYFNEKSVSNPVSNPQELLLLYWLFVTFLTP